MPRFSKLLIPAVLFLVAMTAQAGTGQMPEPDESPVYSTAKTSKGDDVALQMHLFKPEGWQESDKRPAVVFFFGGGWKGGSPKQFYPFCEALAARGMVCAAADYRVSSRHGTQPEACVADGRSAVAYLRTHAAELGIDPQRIAAGGGSAGGHVAVSTALLKGGTPENLPNALVAYNPVIDTSEAGYGYKRVKDRWRDLSPLHQVRENLPPTMICHGTADTTTPFSGVAAFEKAMLEAGNQCLVLPFEGRNHGFFNATDFQKKRDGKDYAVCLDATQRFFEDLNWLDAPIKIRGGLNATSTAFAAGIGHVVFMGGSITRMGQTRTPGWTQLVQADLQQRYPDCQFTFENVGIPSIGSVGNSHRFTRDVLGSGKPDLLVIEAAVNDLHIGHDKATIQQAMEGVVRSARRQGIEVLMLHFADVPHLSDYSADRKPMVLQQHDAIAQYYNVPVLDLALHVQQQIEAGNINWARDLGNCHVPAFGQKLYGKQIGVLLDRAWAESTEAVPVRFGGQALPKVPLYSKPFTNGQLHAPASATDLKQTVVIDDWKPSDKAVTRTGFVDVPMLEANGAGSSFSFAFTGTGVGLWAVSGPDAAKLRFRVDDSDWQTLETFTQHSKRLHLPRAFVLAKDLQERDHRLEVEVMKREAGEKGGEVCRAVHLMSHGE